MPRSVGSSACAIGDRDQLITIKKLKESSADSNFPKEDFSQPMQVWACREYVSLDEAIKLDQLSATAVVRFEIPYMRSMDPDRVDVAKVRQIVYLDRVYNIIAAEMLQRSQNTSIILTTVAKVG